MAHDTHACGAPSRRIYVALLSMYVLGFSAFYHDSAAVLLSDGKIVAAAEEERFTRRKHDNAFPAHAIAFCLARAGIAINDVAVVAYYERPLRKFERLLEGFVETYPRSLVPFVRVIPEWLGVRIRPAHIFRKATGFSGKIVFIPHHVSHAAAAFYPSPFHEAAVLTVDGVGEYQTTGLWEGAGNTFKEILAIDFPNSLGLLYSTFTAFLGFRVNEDEYKVMGLAAFGKARYTAAIEQIVTAHPDGSFSLNPAFFSFREGFRMWSSRFEKLFGPSRKPGAPLGERERDIAASIQRVLEHCYIEMLRTLHEKTGKTTLCVGGGVAMNAVANGKIFQETPFTDVYIFGPSGDSGTAAGAALFAYHHILGGRERNHVQSLDLGSSYDSGQIRMCLADKGFSFEELHDERVLLERTAALLTQDAVVGWFQGSMEFGPRALGMRSLLANPQSLKAKERLLAVKQREVFRPFAVSVLENRAGDYFTLPETQRVFPFMNFCFPVREEKKTEIRAVVHEDGSCRIQTVGLENGRYARLLSAYAEKTGVPCLLNTSFNTAREPIVETPNQAIRLFSQQPIDYLVIGNFLVTKSTGRG